MYTNARSLANKIEKLELMLLKHNYDMVGISETWLDESHDWAVNLHGYSLFRNDRMDRYHNIGILVLFLHDFNDILLEFTKLNIYFKTRGGKYHKINAFITDIGSVLFSVSWFWFRLYWFPMKVLYVTCCSSLESNPNIPFYFFFNILLFLLTLMNIYWFLTIQSVPQNVNDRNSDVDKGIIGANHRSSHFETVQRVQSSFICAHSTRVICTTSVLH
ncbi:unnamed protein product [Ranitomeya imitator]|uniref:TLC domain-containing protein n=1 Tax=Ranitomeya imitator TaxID=111125 RepID=A0ABN9LPV5_9NEOB|nr:unnamed protein product [Ranitomeya imitator]